MKCQLRAAIISLNWGSIDTDNDTLIEISPFKTQIKKIKIAEDNKLRYSSKHFH